MNLVLYIKHCLYGLYLHILRKSMKNSQNYFVTLIYIITLTLSLPISADIANKNQPHEENIEKLLTDGRALIKALQSKYSNPSLTDKSISAVDNLIKQIVIISTALATGTGVGFLASINLSEQMLNNVTKPLLNQAYSITLHSRTGGGPDLRELNLDRTSAVLFTFFPAAVAASGFTYLIMKKVLEESQISEQELQSVISELHQLEAIIAQAAKAK